MIHTPKKEEDKTSKNKEQQEIEKDSKTHQEKKKEVYETQLDQNKSNEQIQRKPTKTNKI